MGKFPKDARREDVLKALNMIGFNVVRNREHISLTRTNRDGTKASMTIPNHRRIKSTTLKFALMQAGVDREDFLKAFALC